MKEKDKKGGEKGEKGERGAGGDDEVAALSSYFAVDLSLIVNSLEPANSLIPNLFETGFTFVESSEEFLSSEGIYRLSGNSMEIQEIVDGYNKAAKDATRKHAANFDFASAALLHVDLHAVTGAMKLFLRKLTDPLCTFERYPEFMELADENKTYDDDADADAEKESEKNAEDGAGGGGGAAAGGGGGGGGGGGEEKAIVALCVSLPPAHRQLLARLLTHLARVTAHSEVNKMTPENLAIVFGPTILRKKNADVLSEMADSNKQAKCVIIMLKHYEAIVERIDYQTYANV